MTQDQLYLWFLLVGALAVIVIALIVWDFIRTAQELNHKGRHRKEEDQL